MSHIIHIRIRDVKTSICRTEQVERFSDSLTMSQIPILTLTAPTPRTSCHLARFSLKEILRYRYHHGPNIGSIFVLENGCTARRTLPVLREAVSSMPLSCRVLPTLPR